MSTRIAITNLQLHCPRSPDGARQPLRLDLQLDLPTAPLDPIAFRRLVVQQAFFLLDSGGFSDLDSAAWILLRWLLLPPEDDADRPPVIHAAVHLRAAGSPDQASLSGAARDQEYEVELKDWGTVDIVAETGHLGFYRLSLAPGGHLPEHHHLHMREAELVVSPGLQGWKDGRPPRPLPVGTLHRWRTAQRHGYHNPGSRQASLLCMDAPPFDPADEITTPLELP